MLWYNKPTDGALAEKLGNGLQNRVDGSVTLPVQCRRVMDAKKIVKEYSVRCFRLVERYAHRFGMAGVKFVRRVVICPARIPYFRVDNPGLRTEQLLYSPETPTRKHPFQFQRRNSAGG